ncbi:MAG: hypothetical protein COA30_00005 [Sulfurimonas sp.]|nr:MAG: hypothetical protein COA30_00005 [Sulfurimonas sp.]
MALTHSVSKRLEYVEFLLMFRGWVYRHDLVDYFGISEAAATRDFKDYKHLCPNNMDMNNGTKRWELRDSSFESYFPITQSTVFSKFKMPGICESLGLLW